MSFNIDFTTFALNIKSANNPSSITPVSGSQNLAGNGVAVTFTVASACNAMVYVGVGVSSTSDYEVHPQIYLDGTLVHDYSPAAAIGSASGRAVSRSTAWKVPLTAGTHTISGGVFISAGGGWNIAIGAAEVTALVLGNVTA